jgi:hypothetical protein
VDYLLGMLALAVGPPALWYFFSCIPDTKRQAALLNEERQRLARDLLMAVARGAAR